MLVTEDRKMQQGKKQNTRISIYYTVKLPSQHQAIYIIDINSKTNNKKIINKKIR